MRLLLPESILVGHLFPRPHFRKRLTIQEALRHPWITVRGMVMSSSGQEIPLLPLGLAVAVRYNQLLRGRCLILGTGQGSSEGPCLFKRGHAGSVLECLPRLHEAVQSTRAPQKQTKANKIGLCCLKFAFRGFREPVHHRRR